MRRLSAAALLLAISAAAAGNIPQEEFRARRAALRKTLDGAMVLFGGSEARDEVFRFRQEPNFYYLTGWTEPSAVLLITPAREILFLPRHNERAEKFQGKRSSAEDPGARALTGFEQVLPAGAFEAELGKAASEWEKIYALTGQPASAKLGALYPFRELADAAPAVAKLRIKKSAAELAEIERATDVSMAGHRAAWKRLDAGVYEYQLAATLTNTFLENGCEGVSYAPIVASGPNGTVLHYSANQRRADRGETIVIDAAAECGHYASDITRTVPVAGKFTAREREIYQIVLGAQKAAIGAVRPGIHLGGDENSINKIAKDYINSHGKDRHGDPLGKYFTHGIGHQVGLQVHDASVDGPLEAGMVITVEPGIYLPEEGLGVRIEDVVLVTANGARVLSAALPKEPDELEKALAR